jgi:RNA polymerase sigma factor for flagellar operon FliA
MPVKPRDRIASLWEEYFATRSRTTRNQLVEHYLPLVESQAVRMMRKFHRAVRYDELCSAGYEGLIQAVENYRPDRDTRFETFCQRRITGAVLDWLRSQDLQSRSVRQFERQRYRASNVLATALSRPPTHDEIAGEMDLPLGRYTELSRASALGQQVSLSALGIGRAGDSDDRARDIPDPDQADPAANLTREMLFQFITRGLSRNQRLVITLLYYEDLTMREVGAVLGISESRVSQIHKEVLWELRRLGENGITREELVA